MAYEFKKITEVDTLDSTPDSAHFLAEVDGAIKRIPKEFVSGGAGGNVTTPDFAQNDEFASDYIKNRTHHSYGYGDTNEISITFDEDILNNYEYIEVIPNELYMVRLTDTFVDIQSMVGYNYSVYSLEDDETFSEVFNEENFIPYDEINEDFFPRVRGWMLVDASVELTSVAEEANMSGMVLSPGLWAMWGNPEFTEGYSFAEINFALREEHVKHIDAKYIPRSIAKYSDLRLENLNDITVPQVLYGWYSDDNYSTKVNLPISEEEVSNPMEAISSLVRIDSSCDSDDIQNVIDYGYLTGSIYEEGVRVPMSAKKIEEDDLESPIEGVYVLQNALYFVTIDSFDLAEGVTLTKGVWCSNFNDVNNHPDNLGYIQIDSFNIVTHQSLIPSEIIDESIARVYDIEKVVQFIGNYMSLIMEEIGSIIPEAIPVPTTATVGQMIVVKAVDENGKPTEWEAVNTPQAIAVADAAGETPTAAEYNALLTALRDAGLIAI